MRHRRIRRVHLRQCPKCGAIYSQLQVERARANLPCRCGKARFSDFVIYRIKRPEGDLIA